MQVSKHWTEQKQISRAIESDFTKSVFRYSYRQDVGPLRKGKSHSNDDYLSSRRDIRLMAAIHRRPPLRHICRGIRRPAGSPRDFFCDHVVLIPLTSVRFIFLQPGQIEFAAAERRTRRAARRRRGFRGSGMWTPSLPLISVARNTDMSTSWYPDCTCLIAKNKGRDSCGDELQWWFPDADGSKRERLDEIKRGRHLT